MPPTPQSPAGSRRNITAVIGRHQALSIDVCRAGDQVAIHAHTQFGAVVITLAEREFVTKARGRVDSNNNPFRSLEQIRELAGETPKATLMQPRRAAAKSACTERCEEAWEYLKTHLHLPARDVAIAYGLVPSTFTQWLTYHQRGQLSHLRREAGLTLRPTSSVEPLPQIREPILKPGGKLL